VLNLKKLFLLVVGILAVVGLLTISYCHKKEFIVVIPIDGYIFTKEDYYTVESQINEALVNSSIKAVIVSIDSRGGRADYIESIYLNLVALDQIKPVIASIKGDALSGGYYVAIAARYIYTTSTSRVGGIGVIALLPKKHPPSALEIETGEYKITGSDVLNYPLKIKKAQENFLKKVMEKRKKKLNVSIEQLAKATEYFGFSAVEAGLVDDIGSTFDAIKKAAKIAGLRQYSVVWLKGNRLQHKPYIGESAIESMVIYYSTETPLPKIKNPAYETCCGEIIVDFSHSNRFNVDDLVYFQHLLLKMNSSIAYVKENFCEALKNASSLIVISPQTLFSKKEVECTKKFVANGGKVILMFDPEVYGKEDYSVNAINSLASNFGILFYPGYIYSYNHSYGVYRNIIVSNFTESELTQGLNEIVLFTSTAVYSKNLLAFSPFDSKSSYTELKMPYPVIAQNDNVIAVGDFTFLTPPYVFLKDNKVLAEKIANFLVRK